MNARLLREQARAGVVGPVETGIPSPQAVASRIAVPGRRLAMAHAPDDVRGEQLRALRTEILLRREPGSAADVIALLSPCPGEGRSQLAAELAIAFAQLGRPTLLVDADLRHPRQHDLFGADNSRGLSHAIEYGGTPCLHGVEGLAQLYLCTAGTPLRNPLEVLLHSAFPRIVDEWRRSFEFVIFDTAPVTPYSDALAVASVAGRVIALSRAQHTPCRDTRAMLNRLAATRAGILGAVISYF